MKSIFIRNFFATSVIVGLCFMILAGAVIGIGRGYMLDEHQGSMSNSAEEVARMASAINESDGLSSWTLGILLSSIARSTGNEIFIADDGGTVVACSDSQIVCEHIGMQLSEDILSTLHSVDRIEEITTLNGIYSAKRFVIARPILSPTEDVIGYVIVSNVIDNMLEAWNRVIRACVIITVSVFLAALVVTMVYSKKMAEPLDEMAAASSKFARGDFSVRVRQTEDASDEMGILIESFNQMADSLERAEERRNELISNISHELRTPMTTISGFAGGILDGTVPPEEERRYLTAIRDETHRLTRLVREMLDVSQLHATASDVRHRSDFDLTELTVQTLLSFESRAMDKELDVDPQIPDSGVMVFADRDAITRVIYNLLDNAIKFAHRGTCITLKLYKDEEKAYLSVKDEGETIPPDDLPYIFDRFHKSDRSRSQDKDGVGLGLYLVKSIITGHGQDIAVKSENGVTEFVFTLALSDKEGRK